ncbi:YafY family protein [Treponema sp.]|uniref:helix-turn-helix transcriptional regulator n=1 Tax=Treponema sp. TaxID=166 RepID=UPI00298E4E7A|nr:YafY family protein [Treponema sp.]MCR5612351.1 YafY family transcriptional regulator [Treponema sp.]
MQIDQLFEFVYILIDKKQVTAKEMSKRFGVSTRTIYRWIEALSVSGVPVYSMKGRSGGIAISENYALDKTVLSEEERLEIVSSLKAFESLSGTKSAEEKLSRLVKTDSDWLEVDFSPWSPEGQSVRQLFGTLRDSILKKKQITFDYFNTEGKAEHRTVYPWKLIYKGQAWYLRAWCTTKKAERFFKLSRMLNVKQTGRIANVTIKNAQSKKSPAVIKEPSLIKIKAKISSSKAFYLLDSFACSETKTNKDKSLTVTFTAPDAPWLVGTLVSFGKDLKIISPSGIKDKVLEMANDITELYKK